MEDGMTEELFDLDLTSGKLEPPMLKAAKAHIRGLEDAGLIDGSHILTCQLVLCLAEAIGKSSQKGQASALSFASKELREAMALLPAKRTIGSFEQLMNELNKMPSTESDPEYA